MRLAPVVLCAAACAHSPMSPADVDTVEHPAVVARVLSFAGPKSTVFRDDASYADKLAQLKDKPDAKEVDRRLAERLVGTKDEKGETVAHGITRFEVADTLRAETLAALPKVRPWTQVLNPADVARALESLLVDDVEASTPDYSRLRDVGADLVVELIVEDFGIHSTNGRAGLYLLGRARAFRISGGELYHRNFISDEVKAGLEPLDPFAVAKNPQLFRERLQQLLRTIAQTIAADLSPGSGTR